MCFKKLFLIRCFLSFMILFCTLKAPSNIADTQLHLYYHVDSDSPAQSAGYFFIDKLSVTKAIVRFIPYNFALTQSSYLPTDIYLPLFSVIGRYALPEISMIVRADSFSKRVQSYKLSKTWAGYNPVTISATFNKASSTYKSREYFSLEVAGATLPLYQCTINESSCISFWNLIESLMRHCPDQDHARRYLCNRVISPLLLNALTGNGRNDVFVINRIKSEYSGLFDSTDKSGQGCYVYIELSRDVHTSYTVTVEFEKSSPEPLLKKQEKDINQASRILLITISSSISPVILRIENPLLQTPDTSIEAFPPPPPPEPASAPINHLPFHGES
ncbi:hypothetical protein ACWJJH_00500 [Endozoicomonadaceae bacterium StTr2]